MFLAPTSLVLWYGPFILRCTNFSFVTTCLIIGALSILNESCTPCTYIIITVSHIKTIISDFPAELLGLIAVFLWNEDNVYCLRLKDLCRLVNILFVCVCVCVLRLTKTGVLMLLFAVQQTCRHLKTSSQRARLVTSRTANSGNRKTFAFLKIPKLV